VKSSIAFVSSTESAIICKKTLQHPTAEQIDRLKTLSVQTHTDPEITVPAALIVLLGAEDPYVRVQVPSRSLNWAVNIVDPLNMIFGLLQGGTGGRNFVSCGRQKWAFNRQYRRLNIWPLSIWF